MTPPKVWKWTSKRYQLAKLIAGGATYSVSAATVGLAEDTVKKYMNMVPEFRAYVDKITMENERVSRAGTIRTLLRIAEEKESKAKGDKDSLLDYLKFLQELRREEVNKDLELEVTFK